MARHGTRTGWEERGVDTAMGMTGAISTIVSQMAERAAVKARERAAERKEADEHGEEQRVSNAWCEYDHALRIIQEGLTAHTTYASRSEQSEKGWARVMLSFAFADNKPHWLGFALAEGEVYGTTGAVPAGTVRLFSSHRQLRLPPWDGPFPPADMVREQLIAELSLVLADVEAGS